MTQFILITKSFHDSNEMFQELTKRWCGILVCHGELEGRRCRSGKSWQLRLTRKWICAIIYSGNWTSQAGGPNSVASSCPQTSGPEDHAHLFNITVLKAVNADGRRGEGWRKCVGGDGENDGAKCVGGVSLHDYINNQTFRQMNGANNRGCKRSGSRVPSGVHRKNRCWSQLETNRSG